MIRYLKESHETTNLYFTSNRHCEICEVWNYRICLINLMSY